MVTERACFRGNSNFKGRLKSFAHAVGFTVSCGVVENFYIFLKKQFCFFIEKIGKKHVPCWSVCARWVYFLSSTDYAKKFAYNAWCKKWTSKNFRELPEHIYTSQNLKIIGHITPIAFLWTTLILKKKNYQIFGPMKKISFLIQKSKQIKFFQKWQSMPSRFSWACQNLKEWSTFL